MQIIAYPTRPTTTTLKIPDVDYADDIGQNIGLWIRITPQKEGLLFQVVKERRLYASEAYALPSLTDADKMYNWSGNPDPAQPGFECQRQILILNPIKGR